MLLLQRPSVMPLAIVVPWVTLSPAHHPVYSAIIAEVCAFTVYHHSNAHLMVKEELLSFAHHYIQASWNTCWMTEWKSGRNWLGACQWPTGRSRLGSHGKHVASSMITSGKRRWGKLRDKLERSGKKINRLWRKRKFSLWLQGTVLLAGETQTVHRYRCCWLKQVLIQLTLTCSTASLPHNYHHSTRPSRSHKARLWLFPGLNLLL